MPVPEWLAVELASERFGPVDRREAPRSPADQAARPAANFHDTPQQQAARRKVLCDAMDTPVNHGTVVPLHARGTGRGRLHRAAS